MCVCVCVCVCVRGLSCVGSYEVELSYINGGVLTAAHHFTIDRFHSSMYLLETTKILLFIHVYLESS